MRGEEQHSWITAVLIRDKHFHLIIFSMYECWFFLSVFSLSSQNTGWCLGHFFGKLGLKGRFTRMCKREKSFLGDNRLIWLKRQEHLHSCWQRSKQGWRIDRHEKVVHLLLKETVFISKENLELWKSLKTERARKNSLVQTESIGKIVSELLL